MVSVQDVSLAQFVSSMATASTVDNWTTVGKYAQFHSGTGYTMISQIRLINSTIVITTILPVTRKKFVLLIITQLQSYTQTAQPTTLNMLKILRGMPSVLKDNPGLRSLLGVESAPQMMMRHLMCSVWLRTTSALVFMYKLALTRKTRQEN